MRRSLTLLSLAVLSLVLPHSAHAIVYGTPDDGHRYVGSFVGKVTIPESGEVIHIPLCTGTLVAPDVVLSAAHCFVGLEELFGVTAVYFTLDTVIDADPPGDEGPDGVVDPGVQLLAGEPRIHPMFGTPAVSNSYDLAVFLLDDPVGGVTPAGLAPADFLDRADVRDDTFVAVGYGLTRDGRQRAGQAFGIPGRRMQAEQHLSSVTRAWATFSMNEARGNGGTCYGDSGGPHLHGDMVVSVTVMGDTFCKATDKTYRIDTPWAREFLSRYVTVP